MLFPFTFRANLPNPSHRRLLHIVNVVGVKHCRHLARGNGEITGSSARRMFRRRCDGDSSYMFAGRAGDGYISPSPVRSHVGWTLVTRASSYRNSVSYLSPRSHRCSVRVTTPIFAASVAWSISFLSLALRSRSPIVSFMITPSTIMSTLHLTRRQICRIFSRQCTEIQSVCQALFTEEVWSVRGRFSPSDGRLGARSVRSLLLSAARNEFGREIRILLPLFLGDGSAATFWDDRLTQRMRASGLKRP